MTVIDEVKQKTDILAVVGKYVKLTRTGRTFRGLCPFHEEKHGSFFVYPERQSWHCFGACGTGGDVLAFVMKKENLDFGEALRLLAGNAGVTIPDRFQAETRAKEKEGLYKLNDDAAHYYHEQLLRSEAAKLARDYVAKRGLIAKTLIDFKLGYAPNTWDDLKEHLVAKGYPESDIIRAGLALESEKGFTLKVHPEGKVHDRFRNKLMFPIADERNRIIGFGARVLDDSEPKYVNSPQTPLFDKSGSLYGIGKALSTIRQKDEVVIVEGYMDVITAHQNGFTNVVAAMGTAINEKQINLIKRFTRNVKLALDADSAGEEAMQRCASLENNLGNEIRVVRMPEGKDPDDLIKESKEAWEGLTAGGVPVVDYIFEMTVSGLDLTRVSDKTLAASKLLPVIGGISDPIRESHYLEKLANLVRVDARRLEVSLNKNKKGLTVRPKTETPSIQTSPDRIGRSPIEEYILALILKYPELKEPAIGIQTDYFESSENREIFNAWQKAGDADIKELLPPEIWEHLDSVMKRELAGDRLTDRFNECTLRLREKHIRSLETEKAAILATEAESGGTPAELAKLAEQGVALSEELRKIFLERGKRGMEKGGRS